MDVIQTGTNIATVKISELPTSTATAGRATLATNEQTNQSEPLELPKVAEATQTALDAAQPANQSSQAALASAATANQAAQAADTARENIAGDLAQKSSMFTGAIMGKGKFYSTAESLLLDGDMTLRVVFKTGSDVSTPQQITRTTYTNGGMNSSISNSTLAIRVSGSRYTFPVLPNNLYEMIIIKSSDKGSCVLNAVSKSGAEPTVHVDTPTMLLLGVDRNDGYRFSGVFISAQIFSFAFSNDDAAASWNGGHPELWRVPDVLRYKSPTVWPTAIYKSGNTFYRNDGSIVQTDNIPAANGFSKDYQRFEQSPVAYCGFLSVSALNTKPFRWKFTIEYRADSSVTVEMKGGYSRPALTLDANTGDAKTVQFVTDAGYGVALRTRGGGTYLEVATISVEPANIVCNLIPASLTPTVWKDISGQGNDIPYVPFDSNPAECEMAYENMGFPDTIIGTEAPAVIPNFIGQRYVDTTNKAAYTAYGTSSASDWK